MTCALLCPTPNAHSPLNALKPLRRCGSFGRGDPIERAVTRNFRHKEQPRDIPKSAFAGNRKYALSWLFHLAGQYSSGAASYRDSLSNSTRPRWHSQSISQRACQRSAQSRPSGVVDARAESGLVCRQRSTLFSSDQLAGCHVCLTESSPLGRPARPSSGSFFVSSPPAGSFLVD